MKFVLLAAAALIAGPAIAQDTTQTDPAMSSQTGTMPATAPGADVGGYQPAQPALAGTPQPGATVIFRQAPSPSEAFPPPAAKESYPICKKGQFDQCRQRGGK